MQPAWSRPSYGNHFRFELLGKVGGIDIIKPLGDYITSEPTCDLSFDNGVFRRVFIAIVSFHEIFDPILGGLLSGWKLIIYVKFSHLHLCLLNDLFLQFRCLIINCVSMLYKGYTNIDETNKYREVIQGL